MTKINALLFPILYTVLYTVQYSLQYRIQYEQLEEEIQILYLLQQVALDSLLMPKNRISMKSLKLKK